MTQFQSQQHLHVEFEPTNICNTVCLHCPHDAISRPYGKMDMDTYQSAVDQITAYTPNRNFEFAGMGEPLLNPLIYKFIEYALGKAPTSMTTNASALTPQNIDRLVKAGLNHLTISFNGDDPAIYELMMGGLSFERAFKNLTTAVSMSQGSNMVVGANVSVTRQTQPQLGNIKQFLNDAGIEHIYFSKCHNRGGFLKGDLVCTTPPPPVDQVRCDIFSNTLFIAWSGEVLSCCHDLAGNTALGNLNPDGIESPLPGVLPGALNTIIEKKKSISKKGVRFDICRTCNDLYRFMNDIPLGGGEIGEWVYDLYVVTDKNGDAQDSSQAHPLVQGHPPTNALSSWLLDVYASEGKEDLFFKRITQQLQQKDQFIKELQEDHAYELARLQSHLDEIVGSRSWKAIEKLRKIRSALLGTLFPKGSSREKWFLALLHAFSR